jgi:hypothetical protein
MVKKIYPYIQKADENEDIQTFDGVPYHPVEYVTVYRSRTDDNNICYDSARELTDKEVARLQSEGKDIRMEFIGGVGCIYGKVGATNG